MQDPVPLQRPRSPLFFCALVLPFAVGAAWFTRDERVRLVALAASTASFAAVLLAVRSSLRRVTMDEIGIHDRIWPRRRTMRWRDCVLVRHGICRRSKDADTGYVFLHGASGSASAEEVIGLALDTQAYDELVPRSRGRVDAFWIDETDGGVRYPSGRRSASDEQVLIHELRRTVRRATWRMVVAVAIAASVVAVVVVSTYTRPDKNSWVALVLTGIAVALGALELPSQARVRSRLANALRSVRRRAGDVEVPDRHG